MKLQLRHYTSACALLVLSNAILRAADDYNSPFRLEADSGIASFESTTNMPGIDVKGKSTALAAHVDVAPSGSGLALRAIDASVSRVLRRV